MEADGAGKLVAVRSKVKRYRPGDAVVINPSLNWGTNARIQGNDYEILGFPTQGTFAEFTTTYGDREL